MTNVLEFKISKRMADQIRKGVPPEHPAHDLIEELAATMPGDQTVLINEADVQQALHIILSYGRKKR